MNQLIAISYVSSAVRLLSPPELDHLLVHAREFNQRVGVTGALLHHDGSFFQYIEGDVDSIKLVYQRICHSSLHRGIIQLLEQPIGRRYFSAWHMGYSEAPQSQLQQLAQVEWKQSCQYATPGDNPGIRLLLHFWNLSRQSNQVEHHHCTTVPQL